MRIDTVLKLGDFSFSRYEIPSNISFGGDQNVAVHDLVGGGRVIDAMGKNNAPLEWTGLFYGQNSLSRARYIDNLRMAGKALELSWSEFRYSVVIKSFHAPFETFYRIPYSISCIVVDDLTKPVTTVTDGGVDFWVRDDMNSMNTLGGLIGDGPLSVALGSLNTAINTVSDIAKAAQNVINTIATPLAQVTSRVHILISSAGNTIGNISTLGGVLPNNSIAQQVNGITNSVTGFTQLPNLYNLQALTGRMGGNLGNLNTSGQTVTQAGGDLYSLASNQYGDASEWALLARANNLSDPSLIGVNNLIIPATTGGSGGILTS